MATTKRTQIAEKPVVTSKRTTAWGHRQVTHPAISPPCFAVAPPVCVVFAPIACG